MIHWLMLLACMGAIVYSGSKLSYHGDVIAEKTGLGGGWIGLVLMASVTSLPELVTGISSVTLTDAPNIAIGDVLGSCVFNLLIFAFLDILNRPVPLSTRAHPGHVFSAGFGILLLAVVSLNLLLARVLPPIGWIGIYTFVILVIYLVAMRLIYRYELRLINAAVRSTRHAEDTLGSALRQYAVHAIVVVTAALFLPGIGQNLARSTGLGETFIGNSLIAMTTSLPEVVVSVAAYRLGAIDLAIGNLLGSNIFNVFILALDDIFYLKGGLLSIAEPHQMVPALAAMAMTAIAILGLTYRSERKALFLAWDSIGIALMYLFSLASLYALG